MSEKQEKEIEVKHTWKDSVFRHLFKEEENFVKMYEVFTGKKLLPEEIELRNTDSIVLSRDLKNDIAFITKGGKFIVLVEHQSTKCANMGLRMLIYYGELLKIYIKKHELKIYGTKPIKFPEAEFYVAYNGKDSWQGGTEIAAGDVTIKVNIVDINYDNLEVKEKDNTLSGYAYLIKQYKHYKNEMGIVSQQAIDKAFKDCRQEGYLIDYVDKEEFLSMVTQVWTIEQQIIDRENWVREELDAKIAKVKEDLKKTEADLKKSEADRAADSEKSKAEKLEMVKNLITSNVSIEAIASSSQLSKEEVLKIKSQL